MQNINMIKEISNLCTNFIPTLRVCLDRVFSEAIYFFEEFRFLCNEMFCLDREIKKHF